jgi:hypothetical protein
MKERNKIVLLPLKLGELMPEVLNCFDWNQR